MTTSLMTVKEMATRLQVKEKTIYAWASQRRIPFVKINGLIRFDSTEIERWLKQYHMPVGLTCSPARNIHKGLPTNKKDVDLLIESARRAAYSIHGETRPVASPFGEEGKNGAL